MLFTGRISNRFAEKGHSRSCDRQGCSTCRDDTRAGGRRVDNDINLVGSWWIGLSWSETQNIPLCISVPRRLPMLPTNPACAKDRAFRREYLHRQRADRRCAERKKPDCLLLPKMILYGTRDRLSRPMWGCWRRHLFRPLPSHPVPSLKQPKSRPSETIMLSSPFFAAFPDDVNQSWSEARNEIFGHQ